MIDHQMTMLQIKSELLYLWTEDIAVQSYEQWFEVLRPKLFRHFGIEHADFFIFSNNNFIQLSGRTYTLMRNDVIPYSPLEIDETKSSNAFLTPFHEKGFAYADDYLAFRNGKGEILGLLLVKSTGHWKAFRETSFLQELEEIVSKVIQLIKKMVFLVKEERSFRRLFRVTELFNSTMERDVILDGIIEVVKESFPTFDIELLLSHDQNERKHTYKLFDYMNERPSAIDAYVSGKVTMERLPETDTKLINAPIKGRQGIYGVLQINAPIEFEYSLSEKNFIRMVANTAGNALENASLYAQSHRVIEDLQLVNETSRKLNSHMQFDEMLSFLKQQFIKAFQPEEIAFCFYDENGNDVISPLSSEVFHNGAGQTYLTFASAYLKNGKEALFDARFDSMKNVTSVYESLIAIPIMNQEKMTGFILLLHADPYYFSFDSFKLMQALISHSSLALANSMLRDQLQELVDKDHLTKLYTRNYLDEMIERSISNEEAGAFLLVDVDDFKQVNDTYGHSTGDAVLRQISTTILAEVEGKGIAARWGGEEIAVYLPSSTLDEGIHFSKRLIQVIPTVTEPRVTISAGISCWTSEMPMTFLDIFQTADKALYSAKESGKNQLMIHQPSILKL
ncbi:diguanylate cyclase [Sporosarcina sp. ACRSM]|uniref:sensor domain-containing diguanylate cyclase n=1 Tax=Sporosarcina sp. ACRSM TaxID=2918216 RepID=UPI001EF3F8B0|nr:sensor domain-containing diguanylate cyclase [Sporosarcina sp. ACRSM]MCG7335535.1 diguanylate cyclase [Sporosarcina sp. ACRSM]